MVDNSPFSSELEGRASLAIVESLLFDGECVEMPILISSRQAAALEELARRRGLTAAQLLRRIVRDFTARCL